MQYTPEILQSLIPAVQDGSLPPRDRLGLENDLFALVCIVCVSCLGIARVRQITFQLPLALAG